MILMSNFFILIAFWIQTLWLSLIEMTQVFCDFYFLFIYFLKSGRWGHPRIWFIYKCLIIITIYIFNKFFDVPVV